MFNHLCIQFNCIVVIYSVCIHHIYGGVLTVCKDYSPIFVITTNKETSQLLKFFFRYWYGQFFINFFGNWFVVTQKFNKHFEIRNTITQYFFFMQFREFRSKWVQAKRFLNFIFVFFVFFLDIWRTYQMISWHFFLKNVISYFHHIVSSLASPIFSINQNI